MLHLVIVWVAFGKTQIKAQMHVEDAGTSAPGIRLSAKCIPCSWMAGPSWKGIHVAHCMAAEPPGPREHCGEKELHVLKLSFWFFPFYLEAHVTFLRLPPDVQVSIKCHSSVMETCCLRYRDLKN